MRKKKIIDWLTLTGLTQEELRELGHAAQHAWDYIGYECIQANDGKDLPKSHVVEIVMDANYIETNNPKLSPKVKAFVDNYENSPILERYLKKEVFLHSRYGM